MNCKEFEHHLTDYIQDIVPERLKRELDTHRESCPSCARLAAMHSLLERSFEKAEPVKAPEGFAEKMLRKIAETPDNVIDFAEAEATRQSQAPIQAIDCAAFEDNAAAFVDGILDSEVAARMETHRENCPACARIALVHRVIAHTLNTTESVTAPSTLRELVIDEITIEQAMKARSFSLTKLGIYGTASAAAGLIAAAMTSFTAGIGNSLPVNSLAEKLIGGIESAPVSFAGRVYGMLMSKFPEQTEALLSAFAIPLDISLFDMSIYLMLFVLMAAATGCLAFYINSPAPFVVRK